MRVPFDEIEHEEYTDARHDGRPFTGTAFTERGGVLREECDFLDGRVHGLRREFYTDGSLKWRARHEHGVAHGEFRAFHPDSRVRCIASYRQGVQVSEVAYAQGGQKASEFSSESGLHTEWRLDGSVRKVTVYEPGTDRWHGLPREERHYDARGQPTVTKTRTGWAAAGDAI